MPSVVDLVEQIPAGLLHVTLTGNAACNQVIMVVILEWVITEVTGVDQSSATVIITGLVLLTHHSLLVDRDLLHS